MRHASLPIAAVLLLGALGFPAGQEPQSAGVPPIFTSHSVVTATIRAPFEELIANGRGENDFAVSGTLQIDDGGRTVTIDEVRISTRGHTSLRASECTFPKLKIDLDRANTAGTPFAGAGAVKIGTHCSDEADGPGGKYGRWPNEKAAHREAFVYRLLDVLDVASLKARPARITYVESRGRNPGRPLVRDAFFLEDDEEAVERHGGRGELPARQFGSAPSVFAADDLAKLFFAEALIGNFDWCLRMSPRDGYRCNPTTPIWNVLGVLRPHGPAVPLIHDFDIAGMVTTRHLWFDKVFNRAFAPTEADVEVLAQVQRTRSVFPRDLLDRTRQAFVERKSAAYQALAESPMDGVGRETARRYLDAFYAAVERDESFYRPVIKVRTPVLPDARAARPACPEEAPAGTPVSAPLATAGGKSQVVVLDALWQWAEKCEPVRRGPVWVATAAISPTYP